MVKYICIFWGGGSQYIYVYLWKLSLIQTQPVSPKRQDKREVLEAVMGQMFVRVERHNLTTRRCCGEVGWRQKDETMYIYCMYCSSWLSKMYFKTSISCR